MSSICSQDRCATQEQKWFFFIQDAICFHPCARPKKRIILHWEKQSFLYFMFFGLVSKTLFCIALKKPLAFPYQIATNKTRKAAELGVPQIVCTIAESYIFETPKKHFEIQFLDTPVCFFRYHTSDSVQFELLGFAKAQKLQFEVEIQMALDCLWNCFLQIKIKKHNKLKFIVFLVENERKIHMPIWRFDKCKNIWLFK